MPMGRGVGIWDISYIYTSHIPIGVSVDIWDVPDQGRNSECLVSKSCAHGFFPQQICATEAELLCDITDLHPGYTIGKNFLLPELDRRAFPSKLLLWRLRRCNYPSSKLLILLVVKQTYFQPLSHPARAGSGTEREIKIKIWT